MSLPLYDQRAHLRFGHKLFYRLNVGLVVETFVKVVDVIVGIEQGRHELLQILYERIRIGGYATSTRSGARRAAYVRIVIS